VVKRRLTGARLYIFVMIVTAGQQWLPQTQAAKLNHEQKTATSTAPRFIKAFVADDRLSVLRREPTLKSIIIHRLRTTRPVYIFGAKASAGEQPAFYHVAVTRRTRGWIHQAAVVIPGRSGDDQKLMLLIDEAKDSSDKIALSNLLVANFARSPLVPQALLKLGEEAERSAASLNNHAHKRLADLNGRELSAAPRDYYLNDSGLDRLNKMRVTFDFNQTTGEYVYDGKAYREILARFPSSDEATKARAHLEATQQRLAKRQ
jgi:hypothetical protein